ncbi:hypothetical protein M405DRAFT_783992 [Rhizopogon salebrosus TDB-379]|nr:hypothetical protein M405DRAFT_783992 [Rhizopogon salebrosus TDB-379]
MRLQPGSQACLLVLVLAVELVVGVDFTQCLNDLKANANASQDLTGLLDSNGYPVSNVADAAAISYSLCTSACGAGQEPFQWPVFSQDFSAWLLPNLALISQLPFGARYRPDNLMSAVLTIGSPVLAGYSLFITLLNSRWINRRFSQSVDYPNSRFAVSILSSLQQVPLRIHHDFPSLVVLPENDIWWKYFSELVNYTHTWSIASAASIAWVVIAYILTVVNSPPYSFGVTADGEDTASMWLWLIPIVVGWLQLSPKCDFNRLQEAYERADRHTRRAAVDSHMGTSPTSTQRALTIAATDEDVESPDELITAPVFNYSRSLRWASTAESIFLVFNAASEKAKKRLTVRGGRWVENEVDELDTTVNAIYPNNRRGSSEEIALYCAQLDDAQRSHWAPEVFERMAIASCTSLALQWGTVGASVIVAYFTPTTRIGCRSLSYLLYAAISTVVWMMLVLSSILVHYSAAPSHRKCLFARVALALSHWLRRVAKLLAIANSIWVILMCALQYSQFYDTCYCNASVTSRGKAAYTVIIQSATQIREARTAWIGSLVLACSSAMFFFGLFNLLSDT